VNTQLTLLSHRGTHAAALGEFNNVSTALLLAKHVSNGEINVSF